MKIEIDLQDILGDEYGDVESLAESIQRQVIDNLTNRVSEGILKKVDNSISELLNKKVEEFAKEQLPSLFDNVIDKEYSIVDRWGSHEETTTMRKKLVTVLTDQMVYKSARYDSEKNYFTKNVDEIMSEKMSVFKKDFNTKVDEAFSTEALAYASAKMIEKFKISKS